MTGLHNLIEAVRRRLSEEDRRLIRTVRFPPSPERYDEVFDRVLERLRSGSDRETDLRPRAT